MTHEYLSHTADVRVALEAPTLEGLLAETAAVVRELAVGAASPVGTAVAKEITVTGASPEELLYGVMKELLYLFNTTTLVPGALEIRERESDHLTATVRGERFDPARHEQQPEVKAVTRHGLRVRHDRGIWRAEVIVDL